jgi:hypothetical protein
LLVMASTTGYYHRGQVKGRTLVSMKNDWKQISVWRSEPTTNKKISGLT